MNKCINLKNFGFLNKLLIILGVSLSLLPQTLLAKDDKKAPNIVFIVADYMGYADIEPYGSTDIKTPSINTLASQGTRFLNHYSAAPSCVPSRASLMSGKYPEKVLERFALGRGQGLHTKKNYLLNGLNKSGYKTGLIGKWHLGAEKNFSPNDHGFDYFLGFNSWTLGYYTHLTSDGAPGLMRNKEPAIEKGYLTDVFTDEAVEFIDKSADNPFFLYLSYNAGLPPYQTPNLPKSEWGKGWDANDASRTDYISMIERMDQGIGKVLNKLSEHKLEDNTVVIFTYDHGGRHLVDSGPLFHGFGTLWEGGIRVPLIIRWPNKVKKEKTFETPTIAMDVTATILDVAQTDTTINYLDGTSLFDIMKNTEKFENRGLYWRHRQMKAVRKNNWKYVVDGHSQLLFNIDADIGERNNMFHKNTKKVNELKQELESWENALDKH